MTVGSHDDKPERIDRRRLILSLLATPLFFALFMFLPAGTWAWTKGWLFIGVFVALAVLASLFLRQVNPALLAARINAHQGTKPWDKVLLGIFLLTALAIFPVAALDDGRFRWCPVPGWVSLLGYALLLIGLVLLTWVGAVNKFFEPTVRIQTDRGQTVIDTGPYAIVRHPGYVSWLPMSVGTALCLGSLWALIPAGLSMLVLILRTQWEDQTLQAELPGYKAYTERVRYRLLPWVW
jgi:protein-S-isoprenylcysteine O-methyltransferase Ste14